MSMIRSIHRAMAREALTSKGYTHIARPNTGAKKKGRFRQHKRTDLGSGSWFATFWRHAKELKSNLSRDELHAQKREQLMREAKYIIRMHKNGRDVATIAHHTGKKPSDIKALLKVG